MHQLLAAAEHGPMSVPVPWNGIHAATQLVASVVVAAAVEAVFVVVAGGIPSLLSTTRATEVKCQEILGDGAAELKRFETRRHANVGVILLLFVSRVSRVPMMAADAYEVYAVMTLAE